MAAQQVLLQHPLHIGRPHRLQAGEAPVGLDSTGNASLYAIWTTMHVPALTLPVFKGPNGLPVGAQLIATFTPDGSHTLLGLTAGSITIDVFYTVLA